MLCCIIHLPVYGLFFAVYGSKCKSPEFKLVPVDQVETSQNTVTCTVHQSGDRHYLYSAGDNNKIDVFEVQADGKMELITHYVVTGGQNTVRGLVTDRIDGNDFLFAGLKGGNAIEVIQNQSQRYTQQCICTA